LMIWTTVSARKCPTIVHTAQ